MRFKAGFVPIGERCENRRKRYVAASGSALEHAPPTRGNDITSGASLMLENFNGRDPGALRHSSNTLHETD